MNKSKKTQVSTAVTAAILAGVFGTAGALFASPASAATTAHKTVPATSSHHGCGDTGRGFDFSFGNHRSVLAGNNHDDSSIDNAALAAAVKKACDAFDSAVSVAKKAYLQSVAGIMRDIRVATATQREAFQDARNAYEDSTGSADELEALQITMEKAKAVYDDALDAARDAHKAELKAAESVYRSAVKDAAVEYKAAVKAAYELYGEEWNDNDWNKPHGDSRPGGHHGRG